mmetsp:Transcript_15059/g.40484  ORF Transcript_15059/g.40484 Transcript_15059/m.40484 type:complete len:87 (-) Transcript_15059:440-700(-)
MQSTIDIIAAKSRRKSARSSSPLRSAPVRVASVRKPQEEEIAAGAGGHAPLAQRTAEMMGVKGKWIPPLSPLQRNVWSRSSSGMSQ